MINAIPLREVPKTSEELIKAVYGGKLPLVKHLLSAGVSASSCDRESGGSRNESALIIAAYYKYPEIMSALIEYGADLNAVDDIGETALMNCVNGADVTSREHDTRCMKILLDHHADLEIRNEEGFTVLTIASKIYGMDVFVKMLIEHGASMSVRDDHGNDGLMSACYAGVLGSAKLLIASGADVNNKNDIGLTPLIKVARRGYADIGALLIEHGANIHAVDNQGLTILENAEKFNQHTIATIIQAHLEHDYIIKELSQTKKSGMHP